MDSRPPKRPSALRATPPKSDGAAHAKPRGPIPRARRSAKSTEVSLPPPSEQVDVDTLRDVLPSTPPSIDAEVAEGAILVTGICGRLGRLVARSLHRDTRVIGIDRRPFRGKPKDILHHQFDLRSKKTRDVFRSGEVRAVVHLGVLHDPRASDKEHHSWNIVAFQRLLENMIQYEVPKLIVLSSANVYGPQPDNPQFLSEEAPLLGAQAFRGIRDLVELDMLAQSFFWRHPGTDTVILRPCHILGAVHNAPSNYLRLERPVTVLGFDPMVQVIHERDVVSAIRCALKPGVRGIFNLRGPGELPLSRILRTLGRTPMPVPGPLASAALEQMWRLRMTTFPPPELDHIRYVCMVDDTRAREVLGYRPAFDMEQTIAAVLED